jgi:hypothetical protein
MSIWKKSVHGALVGLMLLLTGAAPLFTVAVDNDNDDETPPITVELNLDAPSRKVFHMHTSEASLPSTATEQVESLSMASFTLQYQPTLELETGLPQLVVPLRT